MGIRSRLLSYDFDDCVFAFGNWVQNRLNETDPKTKKARYTPEQALGIHDKPKAVNVGMFMSDAVNAPRIQIIKKKAKPDE